MPRKPRLVVAKYPHHVILRGNNRSAIFNTDQDRRFFINCLKEIKDKTKSRIYSYCLMTNHVHLIIEPSIESGLSNAMQSLGRRYVQYFNYANKRTGTLWEGRFKSSLISKDDYLIACSRYIELNPVRAKMVKQPRDYPWSSFRFKAEGKYDILLDEDTIYAGLGITARERQLNYRRWFINEVPEDELDYIRNTTQRGGIIGSKEFINKMSGLLNKDINLRDRGRPKKSL